MGKSAIQAEYERQFGGESYKPLKKSLSFKDDKVGQNYAYLDQDLRALSEDAPSGTITSTYRDPEENTAVGGVPNSFHTKGKALDYRLDENTDAIADYYKQKGYKAIREKDHLHVEPANDSGGETQPKPQGRFTDTISRINELLNQEPDQTQGVTVGEVSQAPPLPPDSLSDIAKSVGRALKVTAGGLADPALELTQRFNPIALGNNVIEALGGQPLSNKYVDDPLNYLRELAQQAQQEPLTEFEKYKGIDLTAPIATGWPEATRKGVEGAASGLGINKDNNIVQTISGGAEKLAEMVQGMTSPPNIAMLLGAGIPGAIGKASLTSFVPSMLKGSEEEFKQAGEGFQEGDPRKIGGGLVGGLASAGFAGAAGAGAVRPNPLLLKDPRNIPRPMEFLDYPDPTGAAKYQNPALPPPPAPPRVREFIPEGKGQAYTSEPIRSLKKEPFNVKTLVEEQPVSQISERTIQPKSLKVKEKPLFPFIPESLIPETEAPNPLSLLPESVQPREATGFETNIKSLKRQIEPYPESYSAKANITEAKPTFKEQIKEVKAKKVPAVLVAEGEVAPKVPSGMRSVTTEAGKFIYDPLKVSAKTIKAKVENGTYEDILSRTEPKAEAVIQKSEAIIPDRIEATTTMPPPEVEGLRSRVYERLKEEHPDILKEDPRYQKMTIKDEISKATDMLEKNPTRLHEIANDFSNKNEISSTIANITLADKALKDGNYKEYGNLTRNRSLDLTKKGQDIVAEKASISDNSTNKYVKQLIQTRLQNLSRERTIGEKFKKGVKKESSSEVGIEIIEKEVKRVKEQINKSMDLKAAQSIFERLKCK